MHPVKSSNISHVGYEGTTLTIQFKSGAAWSYHDVPEHVHRDLMAADSVGGYFGSHVKNKFKGTRHEEE
jgi:hypothetical protein